MYCPYCGLPPVFTSSKEIYNGRDFGMIYLCRHCDAYVGVHKGTTTPLGRLADNQLRILKTKAHKAFDIYWFVSGERSKAYYSLAKVLGLKREDCHIGLFDIEMCEKVILACEYDLIERKP